MRKHILTTILFVLVNMIPAQGIRPVNTYSIVALDETTGELGVAVQSHWFSVGALVPWAQAGVGAVATQSFIKVAYGPEGLQLMREGKTAEEALTILLDQDEGKAVRQVGMVDAIGNIAVHTGKNCIDFAGHIVGKNYTVQANLMEKSTVPEVMANAFESTSGGLADRMLAALEAAQNEGGDLRGKQSAAMLIVSGKPTGISYKDVVLDLRIEDHPTPIKELKRLIRIHKAYIHANKGDHYMETGQIELALKEYDQATEYYPENPELPFWTAVTLVGANRLDEALPIFKDVFARDPKLKVLVSRLVKSKLFPDDKDILRRVINQ
ncbi:MAG TPA: DUF1028 domain-containing protein [Candidatus Marinimicrobia bacterium]|nr:DUF1028 domain-containing protein [Candidatus Neomarinimicrobiota bacterium]